MGTLMRLALFPTPPECKENHRPVAAAFWIPPGVPHSFRNTGGNPLPLGDFQSRMR